MQNYFISKYYIYTVGLNKFWNCYDIWNNIIDPYRTQWVSAIIVKVILQKLWKWLNYVLAQQNLVRLSRILNGYFHAELLYDFYPELYESQNCTMKKCRI